MLANFAKPLALAMLLSVPFGSVAPGQDVRPLPPRMQEDVVAYAASVTPDLSLQVDPDPRVAKGALPLYRRAATIINSAKLKIPPNRAAYFNLLIDENHYPIAGWHGFIENVEPFDSGVLVTVRVSPKQTRIFDNAHVMEQYSVVGGRVHYIGTFEPPPYVRGIGSL